VDPLDRELTSLLSIEPSPEFRAKVRARVAGERIARPWHFQWRVAAVGAAAVVVASLVIMRVTPTRPSRPAAQLVEKGPAASVPPVLPVPNDRPQMAPVVALAVRQPAPPTNRAEVLIDVSARRGLRQLSALVRDGRARFVFDDETVPQPPIGDIVVAPIVIEPVTVTTLSESAGEVEGDRP
jgi:hypothetical protein